MRRARCRVCPMVHSQPIGTLCQCPDFRNDWAKYIRCYPECESLQSSKLRQRSGRSGDCKFALAVASKVGSNEKPLILLFKNQGLASDHGGEGGIRTPGTLTRTPDFESGTFNRSATSPKGLAAEGLRPPLRGAIIRVEASRNKAGTLTASFLTFR